MAPNYRGPLPEQPEQEKEEEEEEEDEKGEKEKEEDDDNEKGEGEEEEGGGRREGWEPEPRGVRGSAQSRRAPRAEGREGGRSRIGRSRPVSRRAPAVGLPRPRAAPPGFPRVCVYRQRPWTHKPALKS